MSNSLPVSYAELVRSGVHALRGMGFSFSAAERGAKSLALSEAITSSALRFLRVRNADIREAMTRSFIVDRMEQGLIRLDANGRTMLELSPIISDLLLAYHRRAVPSIILVENWIGHVFLADLFHNVSTSGGGFLLMTAGKEMEPVSQSLLFQNAMVSQPALAPLPTEQAFTEFAGSNGLSRDQLSIVKAFFASKQERLLLVGDISNIEAFPVVLDMDRVSLPWFKADGADRLRHAIELGMDVDNLDFDYFNQCVRSIWLQTSDRSRSQQG